MLSFALECLGSKTEFCEENECTVCHGLFTKLPDLAAVVARDLEGYEFDTLLVGCKPSRETQELESESLKQFESAESLRKEFNREFGKTLCDLLGKETDLKDPDTIVTADLEYFNIGYWIKSLYVRGRYRKLVRGIPQTRWIHQQDSLSVEEVVGIRMMDLAQGKNFFLHGAGREDVDVRMLGNGREFVIEVSEPRKRSIDLDLLKSQVNESGTVEISELRFSCKQEVEEVKATHFDKDYRALIAYSNPLPDTVLEKAVFDLTGKIIYQRTPLRVSRRRADTVREKKIISASVVDVGNDHATIDIRAEAGTYIKELISGDGGRTSPSLSSLCGVPLSVEELDVTGICTEESSNGKNVTRA